MIIASYGGESGEILAMLPMLRQIGARLVAITDNPDSTVSRSVDITSDTGADRGEGMVGWAHLPSIAAGMAMGDALAIAAGMARGFTKQNFAQYHPGGSHGKQLRLAQAK